MQNRGEWKRVVDNRLKDAYGETDFSKKLIKLNVMRHSKRVKRYNKAPNGNESVIDTIIHEELHRMKPTWKEGKIVENAKKIVELMSPKVKKRYYDLYK